MQTIYDNYGSYSKFFEEKIHLARNMRLNICINIDNENIDKWQYFNNGRGIFV